MRAALLCLLLMPAAPAPDVLPPGTKSVRHELVLDWNGDAVPPGHHLIASPTRGFGGHHEIQRGEPFAFSSKYGTRIYVLTDGTAFPSDPETARDAWPNAPVPVTEVNSIAAGNPLARVETTVQVMGVRGDSIEFGSTSERRLDANGNELGGLTGLPLMLIAALGICLLAILAWRLRSATNPGPA